MIRKVMAVSLTPQPLSRWARGGFEKPLRDLHRNKRENGMIEEAFLPHSVPQVANTVSAICAIHDPYHD
ncbi:hypothetical protein Cenrod_2568 [Candidatus Symbiobacter mobilis CR]|uniref:Uncharacterized protein n=2 Tax=Candidatus Symbiobacter TaxID=1436289 RepID=U5NAM9_9BURK|nr:hypothetical protein Cenrod_2568 [Candidatus Symbiobacter mobilis CR]